MKKTELIGIATESPLYWVMDLNARYEYVKELQLLYGEMIHKRVDGIVNKIR